MAKENTRKTKKVNRIMKKENNNIPVFFCCNDKYAVPMAVSLTSIVANTKSFINFYIVCNNIPRCVIDNIEKLKKTFKNFTINYINVDIGILEKLPQIEWYSINMYLRFLIPELKPELERVLYLDCDIIVKDDIQKLFDIELADNVLAAVPIEKCMIKEYNIENHIKDINLDSNTHKYFNSGLLLINCKKWMENGFTRKLFKVIENKGSLFKFPDQDALNLVFENNYMELDKRFNLDINYIKNEDKNGNRLINDIFLIHYSGREKPWHTKNVFLSNYFYAYSKLTPFHSEIMEEIKYKKIIFSLNLFGFLPLFTIKQKRNSTRIYRLFNFFPLFEIKNKNNKTYIYLFRLLLLFKIKNNIKSNQF